MYNRRSATLIAVVSGINTTPSVIYTTANWHADIHLLVYVMRARTHIINIIICICSCKIARTEFNQHNNTTAAGKQALVAFDRAKGMKLLM